MNELSILIGGKAGFGIDRSGLLIANILGRMGYRIYIYRDYPSIIRGGHTFSIIRASERKVACHKNKTEALLALNQETLDLHKDKLTGNSVVIYDSDSVKADNLPPAVKSIGIPAGTIIKEENAPEIMRNSCLVGALCKAERVPWDILDKEFRDDFKKYIDINLKIARRGYDSAQESYTVAPLNQKVLPLVTGNEATSRGLIKGGLKTYISYPMTPTSPILHYMAAVADRFSLKVVHPESEISVILMALGASYCGDRVAVGTSGGGFCLMTEGLSFSAMAELPVVIVLGQRPGPSTGLPTYSCQTELHFALNAGQGEFARLVVAPGDAEEAHQLSQIALDLAWKYQVPAIILTDKDLGEGTYSFDEGSLPEVRRAEIHAWDGRSPYKRYLDTETGVSPLAFVPQKGNVIKINSYEHDESGLTTESPILTKKMQDKRLRKEKYLAEELAGYETVKIYGNKNSETAILCWGSNKGVCVEAAEKLNLKVVQPLYMSPFPAMQLEAAIKGVKKLIAVESNAEAQLVKLINLYGLGVDETVLKYDGRPFALDELEARLREAGV
ncbi:MAG: 2-oxoacid:acceptor oxidoreductase subunit alpha [Candidatus Omnitrophica bacterium]|nr:2-oxoacid:acceptor oxidoreductase subunit alpha [Candidatus Omnitrophota bacterium]